MHYYLYEIRNNLNGKIYVGVHKTANLDDGYMGSGKVIKSAIERHGIDNFTKVILETFDTSEAMYAREAEIVTDEFLARDDVYNLRRGGFGGFEYINANGLRGVPASEIRSDAMKSVVCREGVESFNSRMSEARRNAGSSRCGIAESLYMRSLGTIAAQSAAAREKRQSTFVDIGHAQGEKNSQFGTCWISHDLVGSKKIKKDLLPEFIDQGWIKGRNIYGDVCPRATNALKG